MKISRTTAAQSDAIPARRPPRVSASTPTIPVTVARRTLGSGRASARKPRIDSSPTAGTARARRPAHRAAKSAAIATKATLPPETATRCVRPVALQSFARSGGSPRGVPVDQSGQQPSLVRRQGGGRTSQSATQSRGDPLQRRRRTDAEGGPRAATTAASSRSPGGGPPVGRSPQRVGWARDAPIRESAPGRGRGRGSTTHGHAPRCVRAGRRR